MSKPSRLSRRRFLAASSLGLAAGATMATGVGATAASAPVAGPAARPTPQDAATPGPPQRGIITNSTASVVMAGFQVIVSTRERLEHLLRTLWEESQLLATAEAGAAALPLLPRRRATDSGELGYHPLDAATADVTIGFGASLFGGEGIGPDRFGLPHTSRTG